MFTKRKKMAQGGKIENGGGKVVRGRTEGFRDTRVWGNSRGQC